MEESEKVSPQVSHPNPRVQAYKVRMTRECDKLMKSEKWPTRRAARRHLQRQWGYR